MSLSYVRFFLVLGVVFLRCWLVCVKFVGYYHDTPVQELFIASIWPWCSIFLNAMLCKFFSYSPLYMNLVMPHSLLLHNKYFWQDNYPPFTCKSNNSCFNRRNNWQLHCLSLVKVEVAFHHSKFVWSFSASLTFGKVYIQRKGRSITLASSCELAIWLEIRCRVLIDVRTTKS